MVTIPGPLLDGRPDRQELVLNDIGEVPLEYAREVLDGRWGQDWALGYAITVHSSQGLTVAEPRKVWIIDDYLQWSESLVFGCLTGGAHASARKGSLSPRGGF